MSDFFHDSGDQVVEYYQDKIEAVIERLEAYPTGMSVYGSLSESHTATQVKRKFIDILKKELLDEDS